MSDALVDLSLRGVLNEIAGSSTRVASGATAATVAAAAAGLVAMTARRESTWDDASSAAGQAEILRRRATELIDESADAFDRATTELDAARAHEGDGTERDDWRLGESLRRAADIPLAVAEVATDVTVLAAEVAARCDRGLRPDAVGACLLAESVVALESHLIEVNLAAGSDEKRGGKARALAAEAAATRERTLRA